LIQNDIYDENNDISLTSSSDNPSTNENISSSSSSTSQLIFLINSMIQYDELVLDDQFKSLNHNNTSSNQNSEDISENIFDSIKGGNDNSQLFNPEFVPTTNFNQQQQQPNVSFQTSSSSTNNPKNYHILGSKK